MNATLIKKDGNVSMDKSFDYLCSRLRNGVYTVKITRKTKPRSIPQNNLMWMWFECLARSAEDGSTKEDWKYHYTSKFLLKHIKVGNKYISVPGSTSKLTTEQFSEFLNKVQADAAVEWGVNLPLPGDRFFDDFVDEFLQKI